MIVHLCLATAVGSINEQSRLTGNCAAIVARAGGDGTARGDLRLSAMSLVMPYARGAGLASRLRLGNAQMPVGLPEFSWLDLSTQVVWWGWQNRGMLDSCRLHARS